MEDVYAANPDLHVFDLRIKDEATNMPHPNDIEVLSDEYEIYFENLQAGDLAINYHMSNSIFILDPDTLEVKFWYTGAGDGAHDIDFQKNGKITLFNNNYRKDWRGHNKNAANEIIEIDPVRHSHRIISDGAEYNIYTKTNGQHEVYKNIAVYSSASQGRFTAIDLETGELAFDFINSIDWKNGKSLHISESFFIEPRGINIPLPAC